MGYLKEVNVKGLWGAKDIHWKNINQDVNILVGINGSGKTTLLNLIWGYLKGEKSLAKTYNLSAVEMAWGNDDTSLSKYEYISTFDVIPAKNSKSDSPLTTELKNIIYTTGQDINSFFDYRLKATNFPESAESINNQIQLLFELINKQFASTKKRITIEPKTNKLVFIRDGKEEIQLEDLSAGEKQFLLIIFKVFLMEKEPYLLLMDEPEISLHVDWQYELINIIRELNPNCQVIIATHSPSIFGDGWGDKVVYMEDILKL